MKQTAKFLTLLGISSLVVLSALVFFNIQNVQTPASDGNLKYFSSYSELKEFISSSVDSPYEIRFNAAAGTGKGMTPSADLSAESMSASESVDYSQTNIQVEGVDEPDFVKTDGDYIYMASGNQIFVVRADPASNMKLASIINFSDSLSDLYINGNKLVVFAKDFGYYPPYDCREGMLCTLNSKVGGATGIIASSEYRSPKSLIYIYDISNKEDPKLDNNIRIDGSIFDSRMIGDYVYVFNSQPVTAVDDISIPAYEVNGAKIETNAQDIAYFGYPDRSYVFTSVSAINVNTAEVNSKVYLTGYTGNVYVSENALYLTSFNYVNYRDYEKLKVKEVILPIIPDELRSKSDEIMNSSLSDDEKYAEIEKLAEEYSSSLTGDAKSEFDKSLFEGLKEFEAKMAKEMYKTNIQKISLDNGKIDFTASGSVPGNVLNQFSMDEHEGNFRIATTISYGDNSSNNMYVLDENLNLIGKLENLAEGEHIYSARFMGEKAYLVTFKTVDPLFVIDLSNPKDPEVLGYLKIPGYSNYIHPYDENHIIGIGKDTFEEKGRAYYSGMKISMFDVSDVSNPIEKSSVVLGDRGTDSPALYDHKAFLLHKKSGVLVIPVSLAQAINLSSENNVDSMFRYGETVWQGAYVFNVSPDEISVRGRISNFDESRINDSYQWYDDYASIRRTLYIGHTLYTISSGVIKASNIEGLEEIGKIELPIARYNGPVLYDDVASSEVSLAKLK